MSSPWCGGGLLRGLRGGPGAGCRRGALDAKPGRPGAGRVTAPLRAALPLGDGALGFLADMPAPRMVRSGTFGLGRGGADPRAGGAGWAAPSAWAAKYRPPWRKRNSPERLRSTTIRERVRRQSQHPLPHLRCQRPVSTSGPTAGGPQHRRLPPQNGASDADSGTASPPAAPSPPPATSPRPPASTPPCDPALSRSTPFAPLPDRVRPPTEHDPKEDISTLVRPDILLRHDSRARARPAILAVLRTAPVPCLASSDRRLPRKTTFATKF